MFYSLWLGKRRVYDQKSDSKCHGLDKQVCMVEMANRKNQQYKNIAKYIWRANKRRKTNQTTRNQIKSVFKVNKRECGIK